MRALEVDHAAVAALGEGPRAARHDVGVEVDGVGGVGDRHGDVGREDLLDGAVVALGAVAHKNLVGRDIGTACLEIFLGNLLPQEIVALLRAVAAEGGAVGHLVHRPVERLDAGRRQRPGDVADAELDHLRVGVGLLEGRHALGDVREEVGGLELQVVFVDPDHAAPRSQ